MAKFVLKKAKTGVMFNFVATNKEVVCSSQVYSTSTNARKGIASVKNAAAKANIENQTVADFKKEYNPKFEIYKDKRGEFRFRLKSGNGQILASGEGYKAIASCKSACESIRKNAPGAEVEWEEK